MDAWVYLFSKFSHEALLFEALALFLGVAGYAVFYLIRKRKYGVAGTEVPANIMKAYLGQLMFDAEEINTQLFGLLGRGEGVPRPAGIPMTSDHHAATAAAPVMVSADPHLQAKLHEMEKRLAEQAVALDSVLNDKMKIEEELANAKATVHDAPVAAAPSDGVDRSGPLGERVKQLEAQLAEYAIIEDDLANLKRLQKENKTLKQQLADAGPTANTVTAPVPTPTAAATPTLAAAGPAPNLTAETPPLAASAKEVPLPIMSDSPAPEIATEVIGDKHADNPSVGSDFESLVDVVEKNLADAAKSETVEASAPTEKKTDEKTEEQLQADFEKMLNS